MDLFTLVAKIGLDSKEYEQGIKGAKQGFEKLDTWMVAKAQLIADGVKRAFSTIADFAKDAVTAAADVAAEKAQFAATFEGIEEAANGVLASVSNDTGILATRLQQVGTKAFSQFKGAGIDAAGALSMMDEYTRIAADAAAYYDISLEDATCACALSCVATLRRATRLAFLRRRVSETLKPSSCTARNGRI